METIYDHLAQQVCNYLRATNFKLNKEWEDSPWQEYIPMDITSDSTNRDEFVVEESGGMKDDGSKLRYDLLPPEPIHDLVEVITYGANKYAPDNWKKVSPDRYIAAAMRHFESWRMGENYDQESNLHHLAHCLCNVLFLLYMDTIDE